MPIGSAPKYSAHPNQGFVTDFLHGPMLESRMHRSLHMETHQELLSGSHSLRCRARGRASEELPSERWALHLEFTFRADTRRLFQALTVPEYLEAWLSLPGDHFGCSTVATRINDDYLLEHSCRKSSAVLITGTYQVCRRRNVAFSWRVDGEFSVPETQVDLRLRGDFENTIVTLRHRGFTCSADSAWHEDLWIASMSRLSRFYGASDSLDSAGL